MCSEEDERAGELTCRQRDSEAGTCVEMTELRPPDERWQSSAAGLSGKRLCHGLIGQYLLH